STDRTQGRLLNVAALFLLLYAVALTLAPAVRARSFNAGLRWEHWIGLACWWAAFNVAHAYTSRRLPGRDPFLLPIAALLTDLKQRGLLEDTMVVFGSEFGRTPLGENRGGNPNATGRDHHPFAFTMLAAGGGIKGGQIFGETDEIGWSIVRDPVDLHDFHATLLNQFGFDHLRLTHRFQGRDFRLTDVAGRVIKEWI
ncbi:MAG TPA: DUF1501 domain-containing protein, partial [Prosthecobacter sp.]|nr:DUF1501 domain-containing protein [Prosthecobacter sp.]